MPGTLQEWNIKMAPAPKILGKTKVKSEESLRNTGNNRTLLVIVVVNVLTGFLLLLQQERALRKNLKKTVEMLWLSFKGKVNETPWG